MTYRLSSPGRPRRLARALALVTSAALLALGPVPSEAAPPGRNDPDAPLANGVVAMVQGRALTFDAFCGVLVEHVQQDLRTSKHGPRAVLDQMIEELRVMQLTREFGVQVTRDDERLEWGRLNGELKTRSGGAESLRDLIRKQGTTEPEFRAQLRHQLRKEKVANHRLGGNLPDDATARLHQVNLVVAKLVQQSTIEYGIVTAGQVPPVKMEPGQVARVNGEAITIEQFGRQLALRLPSDEVRGFLDEECKIGLMRTEGVSVDKDVLDEEIARMKRLWPIERELQREEAWATVAFDDRFKALFKIPVEHIGKSRYHKGLFGLVRRMRDTVKPEEITKEYQDGISNRYGPHILVTDIKIDFAQKRNPFQSGGRDQREARRLANKIVGDAASGVPFERIMATIRARQDPTYSALKLRMFDTPQNQELWKEVKSLTDGQVSHPIARLSEIHIFRREGSRPGRQQAELTDVLADFVARSKAREWLGTRLKDPAFVKARWPLPIQ